VDDHLSYVGHLPKFSPFPLNALNVDVANASYQLAETWGISFVIEVWSSVVGGRGTRDHRGGVRNHAQAVRRSGG